jgi:hypothetical protein
MGLRQRPAKKNGKGGAMFSSAVLDLAIGIIFCFFAVSLAAGAIVEAIASATKWRARTLAKGVGELLNDNKFQGIARELYAHAAINPRGPGRAAPKRNQPAYIDRQLFANALMDLTKISEQFASAVKQAPDANSARPTLDQLHNAVTAKCKQIANPQLEVFLTGIVDRSFGDIDKIRTDLSTWFDLAMDRVSGAYKRWTQLISFLVALVLAIGLNINTVDVATALWKQPKLAEDLIKYAPPGNLPAKSPANVTPGNSQQSKSGDPAAAAATSTSAPASTPPAGSTGQSDPVAMLRDLDTTLPLGWPKGLWKDDEGALLWQGYVPQPHFWIAVIGWLITALSVVFGAPFWFDLLQTFVRLKGSGPSPQEKAQGKGAAA